MASPALPRYILPYIHFVYKLFKFHTRCCSLVLRLISTLSQEKRRHLQGILVYNRDYKTDGSHP